MYERVVVSTDGSERAAKAVEHGLDLAAEHGADVYVIYVVDTARYGEPGLSSMELLVDEAEDFGNDLLAEIAELGGERGLDVVTKCCHGVPDQEIVGYAAEVDADTIVLGYQGHTHRQPDRIGSVAERVVRNADRPVVTV